MKNTAIYAGTFDPLTFGHLDIIERAATLFDNVVVALAVDNYKKNLFSTEERLALVKECVSHLPNVKADTFSGLLVNYVASYDNAVMVRGMRALSDFDAEFQMSLVNKKMCPEMETIFLMTSQKNLYVSSSIVKQLAVLDADVSFLVPQVVLEALRKKYSEEIM